MLSFICGYKLITKVVIVIRQFYEFEKYLLEHANELAYDTVIGLQDEWKPTIGLTRDEIVLITKIAQNNCLAVLRSYHKWISESH